MAVASACIGKQQDSQAYHLQGVLAQPRIGHKLISSCQLKDTFLTSLPPTLSTECSAAGSASSGNVQTTNAGFQVGDAQPDNEDSGLAQKARVVLVDIFHREKVMGMPIPEVVYLADDDTCPAPKRKEPKKIKRRKSVAKSKSKDEGKMCHKEADEIPAVLTVNQDTVDHCQKAKVVLVDLRRQVKITGMSIPVIGNLFAGKRKRTDPEYFKNKIPRIALETGASKMHFKINQHIHSPSEATLDPRIKRKRKMDSTEEGLLPKFSRTNLDSDLLKPPKHQGTENVWGSEKSWSSHKHVKKTSGTASSGAKGEKKVSQRKDEPGKSSQKKKRKMVEDACNLLPSHLRFEKHLDQTKMPFQEEKKAVKVGAEQASKPVPQSNLALHTMESVQVFYALGKNEVPSVSAKKAALATSSNTAPEKLLAAMARPLAKPLSNLPSHSLTKPAPSSLTRQVPTSSTKLCPSSLPKPSLSSLPKPLKTSWPKLVPLPWLEPEPASRSKPMKSSRPKPMQSSRPKPVASSLSKPLLSSLSKPLPGLVSRQQTTSLLKPLSQPVQKPVMKPMLNPSISHPYEPTASTSQASGWSVQASVAGKATGFSTRPAGPAGNVWRPSSACTSSLVKNQPPGYDPSAFPPYNGDTFIPWRTPPPLMTWKSQSLSPRSNDLPEKL